jgi:hypothetical protein
VLRDRRDADALLEELPFRPPNWHQYYEDLWERYPTLAEDWIHMGYLNLPREGPTDQPTIERQQRRHAVGAKRDHRDLLMLAEIRAKVIGITFKHGAARATAQRELDQHLAEQGLRPAFPGGAVLPRTGRVKLRRRYDELRGLIDELQTAAGDSDTQEEESSRALLILFPLLNEAELPIIFSYPYPRRGATAEPAMAILARRFQIPVATLEQYLFPRKSRKAR